MVRITNWDRAGIRRTYLNYRDLHPTFSFRIEPMQKSKLDKLAKIDKISTNELARNIIQMYLSNELVKKTDVVVETFAPGTLGDLCIGFESLRTFNSALVMASITPFGQTGPYASRAGYDFLIQAMGGMMSITGEPSGPPIRPGAPTVRIWTCERCRRHYRRAASSRLADYGSGRGHLKVVMCCLPTSVILQRSISR